MSNPSNNLLDSVKLYYLGGLPETPNAFVISKGRAFTLPPVGGYLVMPRFNAEDLMRRNEIVTPQGGRYSVFTLNARAAEQAARGPQVEVVAGEREFTREELLAMLADIEAKEAQESVEDPNEPEAPVEPEQTSTGRKSKSKNKEAESKPAESDEAPQEDPEKKESE